MKALDLLKKDHRNVRTLLARLQKTTDKALDRRRQLLEKVKHDLQIHTQIEEKLFYPLLRSIPAPDISPRVDQAIRDHHAADGLLARLSEKPLEDAQFPPLAQDLGRVVDRHIEAEETELFRIAEDRIPPAQLKELGIRMQEMKGFLTQPATSGHG